MTDLAGLPGQRLAADRLRPRLNKQLGMREFMDRPDVVGQA